MKNIKTIYEWNKMKILAQDELSKTSGGREYFDKIDSVIKLPKNIDIIKQLFIMIQKEQGNNFNIILTGGFGDWILNLIKKGIIKIPGNVVLTNGSIRGSNNKLGKITTGKEVDIFYKKGEIDNQKFILFDDSYYSGSTKIALEKYLKKHNSSIYKTYVLYDGSDEKDVNRRSLYRYYDYHKGQKLPLEMLLNYLEDIDIDIPKEGIRDKILKKQIETIQEIRDEVNKISDKFKLDKLSHREIKKIIKSYENKIEENMITRFEDYDKEYVKSLIRDVSDFPKKGITFRDIQKVLRDPQAVKYIVNDIYENIKDDNIDIVLGLDARGFILGPMIAQKLGVGFAMARKKGKLPPPYVQSEYELEYGNNVITVSPEIITDKLNVHIHDDLLATGGTAEAAVKLMKQLGCGVASISFIIELSELNGRSKFPNEKVYSFLTY